MIMLNPVECRVLGTMIEKAQTTPAQYPLSLNGLTTGCNQKNNRDPITQLTEEDVLEALDSLRYKGLVREATLSGSRVVKYRHISRETLSVNTEELVLLAELWLRGPQSPGELRSNAQRMAPFESLESVLLLLKGMSQRPEPMVKELARRPGERSNRYTQLFCHELHALDTPYESSQSEKQGEKQNAGGLRTSAGTGPAGGVVMGEAELIARVARLESQLLELKISVDKLASALGSNDTQSSNGL